MSRYGYGVTETALHRLTREVLKARAPEHASLAELIGTRPLTQDEREAMRECLSDELADTGLGPDDEPNERGLLIEAAIAWLGHK